MTGDLHDHSYPNAEKWYDVRTKESGHMMQAALCWLGIYYLIVKPFKLLGCDNPEALKHYNNTGLQPRFQFMFSTWREYENCQYVLKSFHIIFRCFWISLIYLALIVFYIIGLLSILFWLGKDCAWNGLIPSMWLIFVLPTLLIACDFAFSSLFAKVYLINWKYHVLLPTGLYIFYFIFYFYFVLLRSVGKWCSRLFLVNSLFFAKFEIFLFFLLAMCLLCNR